MFEIDATERGNILLTHIEEPWINSWTRIPQEENRWIQVSYRDKNYPAYSISTVTITNEELAEHINKNFGGGLWLAHKMSINGVKFNQGSNIVVGEELVDCSLCGEDVVKNKAIYVARDGDKPRPFCENCEDIKEPGDEEVE